MTRRNATTSSCTNGDALSYDVENRMTSMTTASGTTTLVYNGEGTRIKRTTPTGTTYYIGNYYEVYVPTSGSTTFNKYYYPSIPQDMLWRAARRRENRVHTVRSLALLGTSLQGDHLGSSSIVMNPSGGLYTRQTYFPYGAQRTTEGSALPTDYTFTGQKYDASTTLMYYGARYYDTTLGRFTQPDTLVPSPLNPQAFNRYAYVYNNPVRFTDPSGHIPCNDPADCNPGQGGDDQPTDDPNVQPEPETPYCEQYPEANGCALPPANTGDNQDPDDDGECNMAGCAENEPSDEPQKTPQANGTENNHRPPGFAFPPQSNPDPAKDIGPGGGTPGRGSGCQLLGWFFGLFCSKAPSIPSNSQIENVARYLRTFGPDKPNQAMIERLQSGQWTEYEQRFFQHETLEMGYRYQGMTYEAAHMRALEIQGIRYEPGYERYLYHPDVIRQYRDEFNPAAWPSP